MTASGADARRAAPMPTTKTKPTTPHAWGHVSPQDHLHRQALALRLSAEDAAALRFLIESLNDDGYLSDSLEDLAQSAGR